MNHGISNEPANTGTERTARRRATAFIVLIGTVSLFADMTYEGARSITGPYLGSLGASALVVGFVAGFGELLGYVLRFFSGRYGDRTGHYWTGMFVGYAMNLFCVPLLALAPSYLVAAILMIGERVGRAIRSPLRDATLSHAATSTGQGWGFGLHEAMDQTGATVGPLGVALVLSLYGGYRISFALLLVPAVIAMLLVISAARQYPQPGNLAPMARPMLPSGFAPGFWLYTAAGALIGAGYADYALVAYHFGQTGVIDPPWIPVFYAVAMGAAGAAALGLGWLLDRIGIVVIVVSTLIAAVAAPLVFLTGFWGCLIGTLLWGVGMGAQDSVLKAAVGAFVPVDKRATGYGTFDMMRGIAWFAGSLLLGFLYGRSAGALVIASLALQLLAVPVLLLAMRHARASGP
jgi:MFS family permease